MARTTDAETRLLCSPLSLRLARARAQLRVTPTLQRLLPYPTLLAVIRHPRLNDEFSALPALRQHPVVARRAAPFVAGS